MVVGILFMVGAFVGFLVAVAVKRQARVQLTWPQATGTITSSEGGFMTSYVPRIHYTFYFGDRMYGGHRTCAPDLTFHTPWSARRVVRKYPQGKRVTVYVDAADPEESVLEPGGGGNFVVTAALFALIFFLFGARMVYSAL